MKQLRIGDITIDAVLEREGPWRRPQDFFPATSTVRLIKADEDRFDLPVQAG
jgi:hypothetical protein